MSRSTITSEVRTTLVLSSCWSRTGCRAHLDVRKACGGHVWVCRQHGVSGQQRLCRHLWRRRPVRQGRPRRVAGCGLLRGLVLLRRQLCSGPDARLHHQVHALRISCSAASDLIGSCRAQESCAHSMCICNPPRQIAGGPPLLLPAPARGAARCRSSPLLPVATGASWPPGHRAGVHECATGPAARHSLHPPQQYPPCPASARQPPLTQAM
jgi:hypothetical protein